MRVQHSDLSWAVLLVVCPQAPSLEVGVRLYNEQVLEGTPQCSRSPGAVTEVQLGPLGRDHTGQPGYLQEGVTQVQLGHFGGVSHRYSQVPWGLVTQVQPGPLREGVTQVQAGPLGEWSHRCSPECLGCSSIVPVPSLCLGWSVFWQGVGVLAFSQQMRHSFCGGNELHIATQLLSLSPLEAVSPHCPAVTQSVHLGGVTAPCRGWTVPKGKGQNKVMVAPPGSLRSPVPAFSASLPPVALVLCVSWGEAERLALAPWGQGQWDLPGRLSKSRPAGTSQEAGPVGLGVW